MLILQPRQDYRCCWNWTCANGEWKMLLSVVIPLTTDIVDQIQSTSLTTTCQTVFAEDRHIIAHDSLCAIKFTKDTFHHNIKVSSTSDTGSGEHQFANERQWEGLCRLWFPLLHIEGHRAVANLSLLWCRCTPTTSLFRNVVSGRSSCVQFLLQWYKIMSTWWRLFQQRCTPPIRQWSSTHQHYRRSVCKHGLSLWFGARITVSVYVWIFQRRVMFFMEGQGEDGHVGDFFSLSSSTMFRNGVDTMCFPCSALNVKVARNWEQAWVNDRRIHDS